MNITYERDPLTTLDYSGARYYDSDIGRFLSVDPLAGDFASWSTYNYVFGNPNTFIDPTGREPKSTREENMQQLYEAFGDPTEFSGVTNDDNSYDAGGPGGESSVRWWMAQRLAKQNGGSVEEWYNNLLKEDGDAAVDAVKEAVLFYVGGKAFQLVFKGGKWVLIAYRTNKAGNVAKGSVNLINAATAPSKGGLTAVGHALQKHGSRPGSLFPKATGNAGSINAQGKSVLQNIISNPNATIATRHHARFGNIIEIKIPNGQGARFSIDGKTFFGFIE